MTKTVIIAGAGASLAHAQSLRPRQTRYHPPLDGNFFSTALALAERHSQIRGAVETLTTEIAAADRFYNPFDDPRSSLEQIFADVYYEVAARRSAAAFSVYVWLLRLYRHVLSSTTNWMANHARLGALDSLVRLEYRRASGALTIITFNQDLVLENVLYRIPRQRGQ